MLLEITQLTNGVIVECMGHLLDLSCMSVILWRALNSPHAES
jgi:hypothetical protein